MKRRRSSGREHNETRWKMYREELQLWEVKRDWAEVENHQPHWAKPKHGRLEQPVPKPIVNGGGAKGEGNNVIDGEDSDNEDDVQSDDN